MRFDLVGGGTLIFDEFGTLKFHICNDLASPKQAARLTDLYRAGQLARESVLARPFAVAHQRRGGLCPSLQEHWDES
jgi:hypothetical protein